MNIPLLPVERKRRERVKSEYYVPALILVCCIKNI
jgi:hypothetical protein